MAPADQGLLLRAVRAYKQHVSRTLAPEQVALAIRLLKELNRRLPGQNLLAASLDEIRAAGVRTISDLQEPEHNRFLAAEATRFFDVALEQGLLSYHPLRGTARIHADDGGRSLGSRATAAAAKLVAGIIEEGVQQGLLLSPIAVPLSELGERQAGIDRLVAGLSGRWQELAERFRWLLEAIRVALPIVMVILAINAVFSGSGPFSAGMGGAGNVGQAVRELQIIVTSMNPEDHELRQVRSLRELGERTGFPLGQAAEQLTLLRVETDPPMVFVRHEPSNAFVVITPEDRGVLRAGRWSIRR